MSDIFSDPEVLNTLRPERAPEPAKRWRNKWLARMACEYRHTDTGEFFHVAAGQYVESRRTWPSKDLAESHAAELIAVNLSRNANQLVYLGAFPVEEGE